jgi:hypothetical protein
VEYDKTGQTKTYANAKRGSRKGSKGRKAKEIASANSGREGRRQDDLYCNLFFRDSISYSFLLIGHRLNRFWLSPFFLLPESALSILAYIGLARPQVFTCYTYYHSSDLFDHVFDHLFDLFDRT